MISGRCRRSCIHSSIVAFTVVAVFYIMVSVSLNELHRTSHRLVHQAAAARGGENSIRVDYRNQDDDGDIIFPDQDSGEDQEQEVVHDPQQVAKYDLEPKDYNNPVTDKFCNSFNKYFTKHGKHFLSHHDETFAAFVKRLKKRQKKGKRLFSLRKNVKTEPPWRQFYHEIRQYRLYDPNTNVVKELLENLVTQPVKSIANFDEGSQMKLLLTLGDGTRALLKPMRCPREQETLPDHFYFNDFERHNAEIAAFHLDRVLGFYRVPPTVGRLFNIELDFNDFENTTFEDNFYISPAENKCFFAKCEMYCDSSHPVCGKPNEFEASIAVWLHGKNKALHRSEHNPWQRTYSKTMMPPWDLDDDYCTKVRQDKQYKSGRRLLDVMDTHVFDFLTGNMDRHSIDLLVSFVKDTFPVWFDNGRGFGKPREDVMSILTPIRQCCQIRLSTLAKLVKLYTGSERLSYLMKTSLMADPLNPILTDPHLDAFDRRVVHILNEVTECVDKTGSFKKVAIDDGHM